MKWSAVVKAQAKKKWDALVCGVSEGEQDWNPSLSALGKVEKETQKFFEEIKGRNFSGKEGEVFFNFLPSSKKTRSIFLIGLGKKDRFDLEKLRRITGRVLKHAKANKLDLLGFDLKSLAPSRTSTHDSAKAIAEAGELVGFNFNKYKSKREEEKSITIELLCEAAIEQKDVQIGIKAGRVIGEAANICRMLASEPANHLTPRILADRAKQLAQEAGLTCKILDEKEIAREKMGGVIGVAQGSNEPARFIILETKVEKKSQPPVVLVGKGVTFDSGGISLKPANDMEKMKYDMSGAAAVIATLWLAAQLKLPYKVVGLAPCVENLPSEHPQRPGDIITISNGKTVEVINTDAEGRLILADALVYAQRYNPRYIIDIATLTGSCRATFGEMAIGLMGNNATLIEALKDAGEKSGERAWELPMWDDYRDHVKSEWADLKNVGRNVAGAIIGGKFLEEFVGGKPWAHLDIASTGWFDEHHAYISKGATGAGVRIFTQFLKDLV